jgi:hypothetical protein
MQNLIWFQVPYLSTVSLARIVMDVEHEEFVIAAKNGSSRWIVAPVFLKVALGESRHDLDGSTMSRYRSAFWSFVGSFVADAMLGVSNSVR